MNFLKQVATYLHRAYAGDLHRFCIVFPNVRAGLFFRKYLASSTDRTPVFRSLESLMEEVSGLTQADNLSLIFDLFQAFKLHKTTGESFDDFYFWGEMLLEDFDDVDKNLTDARDLFRNVSDLKEIDAAFDYMTNDQKEVIRRFWQNFNVGAGGMLKTEFSAIWQLLYPIYETFKQRLKAKSLGYGGMIQREAVDLIREHSLCEKYVFIGFNALTRCESLFFDTLQKQNRAIFFWDYDDYYIENDWHEAGKFMRENIQKFPSEKNFHISTRNLENPAKHIEIISVPSVTGQAKLAAQLLETILTHDEDDLDLNRVAVVLPDEYLLLPVLSSLPASARDINITMGYPFTCTPANSFFERLSALQQRVRPYADGARFYHDDVIMLLHHPYIQEIIPDEANSIIKSIVEYNRIYVCAAELAKHELLQLIFMQCTNARDFSQYLLDIFSKIITIYETLNLKPETLNFKPETLNLELETCHSALQRIHDVLATDGINMELRVFSRLLRKNFASLKIPFVGEPLKGLQLMGMLETRALGFDHVIIMSMNEGIFPGKSVKQSFMPYNLRKGFGLPTTEQRDSISAYHFYRLIQRSTDIRLIYNSAATDHNTGEMSRFLSQLIYEPIFNAQQRNTTFSVNHERAKPIVKERTDDVRRILNMYLSETDDRKWLSPSAINNYLDCRLKFYFRYIEGLKEKDEVTDEVDYSVFGKLLHRTMEQIYKPYLNTEITPEILTKLQYNKQSIQDALYRAFAKDYFYTEHVADSDITGRNIIIREVLLKYIMRILEVDKNIAPFTILSLEKRLNVSVPINNEGYSTHINMSGFVDRIDQTHNGLRIIDYKTGNAQRSFSGIADLFDRNKTGNHAVMQTLLYACMVSILRESRVGEGLPSSELYIMKNLFKDDFDPRINISRKPPINNYFDVADEFEKELNQLLSEMFLSDVPFTQTENSKRCQNCAYVNICRR